VINTVIALGQFQRLCQQLREVVYGDALVAEGLGEHVMFFLAFFAHSTSSNSSPPMSCGVSRDSSRPGR